ncbi:MAG: peptide deformylase [Spirochaetaceae bacterium]|jgi:peptide deformylase|nr:peptide deformylase [Spirochaetaceae bacterium]
MNANLSAFTMRRRTLNWKAVKLYDEVMRVLTFGNEALRQKSEPVENIDGEIESLLAGMFKILERHKGVGLAAVQIGIPRRFFITRIGNDAPRVFINPLIIETSGELADYEEGCLSLPGVWGQIMRPKMVRLQARNEKGKLLTIDADGILARVIQHECDHLDGTLFIDKLSALKRERLLNKYEKLKTKK